MFFEQNKRSPVEKTAGLQSKSGAPEAGARAYQEPGRLVRSFWWQLVYHIGLVTQRLDASEPAGLFSF